VRTRVDVRTLVYGMPSSGASLFTCFLAQSPDSVAVIDLWTRYLSPPLQLDFPVILKATINCEISFEDHCKSFNPDRRILFLRNPYDTYQSLSAKAYRDTFGKSIDKLRVLERLFCERQDLFDLAVTYEDFIRNPAGVLAVLQANGFDLTEESLQFPRGPQQIAQFAMDNSDWCRQNYLKQWAFGNMHFLNWGALRDISYSPIPDDVKPLVSAACPELAAYYELERLGNQQTAQKGNSAADAR
jgi:hypothetical protein